MKRTSGILCVAASAFLMCVAGASATYESQSFDAGAPPYGDWSSGSSYSTSLAHSVNALAIPGQTTVSNGLPDIATKVWTDFWTIPTLYTNGTVTAPDIDTSATAQFFVNAASNWVAFSGNGAGGYKTNVLGSVLSGTGAYPKAPNGLNFYNVSILSDYGAHTYSLFVNGNCLATNLAFICGEPVGTVRWFQVQNLAQSSSETCILDEYSLTNKLSSAAASAPITGGGISQSDAVFYFGGLEPRAEYTNASTTANAATWSFSRIVPPYDSYKILGSASPAGPFVLMYTFSGTDMTRGEIDSTSRYYYKVVRISTNDTSVSVTNTEVFATYKQARQAAYWQWVGVPVGLVDYSLSGQLGRQLGVGLSINDTLTTMQGDAVGQTVLHTWNGSSWVPGGVTVSPGMGVLIYSTGAGNTVLAGLQPTDSISPVTINPGWNTLAWPYDSPNTAWSLPGQNGDVLYLQRNNAPLIAKFVSGAWHQGRYGTGPLLSALTTPIQPGDGIIIQSVGTQTWAPTKP
jgi:hypothetical protein